MHDVFAVCAVIYFSHHPQRHKHFVCLPWQAYRAVHCVHTRGMRGYALHTPRIFNEYKRILAIYQRERYFISGCAWRETVCGSYGMVKH